MRYIIFILFLTYLSDLKSQTESGWNELVSLSKKIISEETDSTNINQKLAHFHSILTDKSNSGNEIGLYLFTEGAVRFKQQKLSESLILMKQAESIFNANKEVYYLGLSNKYLGDIHTINNNFRPSLEAYNKAIKYLKESGQNELADECLSLAAAKMFRLGNPNRALTYFQRAFANRKSAGDTEAMIKLGLDIGRTYFYLEKPDSALLIFNDVMLLEENKNSINYIDAANYCMHLESILGHVDKADMIRSELRKKIDKNNLPVQFALFQLSDATIQLQAGKIKEAETLIKSGIEIVKQPAHYNLVFLSHAYHIIGSAYRSVGQYEKAYHFIKEMDRYKDGLRMRNIDRITAEFEMQSEIDVRESEINLLNIQNKLKSEALVREQLLRNSIFREKELIDANLKQQEQLVSSKQKENEITQEKLAKEHELNLSLNRENQLKANMLSEEVKNKNLLMLGLTLLLGFVLLTLYLLRNQFEKNKIIDKQMKDLSVMNKEVHHRVKNNLQVISSLLDLQSRSIQDPLLSNILKDSIRRIQSMAFIHQNLQSEEDANKVDMKEYIDTLSQHLFQSYHLDKLRISLFTNVEEIMINTDKAISIGMIINELISNAMKYAFKSVEQGRIEVMFYRSFNDFVLEVIDNGVGISNNQSIESKKSTGYEIIQAFTKKLKGNITYTNNDGFKVKLQIPI